MEKCDHQSLPEKYLRGYGQNGVSLKMEWINDIEECYRSALTSGYAVESKQSFLYC